MTNETNDLNNKKDKISLSGAIADDFKDMMQQDDFKGTQTDYCRVLMNGHKSKSVVNDAMMARINQCANENGLDAYTIIESALNEYLGKLVQINNGKAKLTGDMKVQNFVNETMARNESATEWFEKVEITQGYIIKKGGFGRPAIDRYLAANQAKIDAHHAKHGIERDHNRRVYNRELALKKAE